MYRLKSLLPLALFLLLATACGLRGPLYLPETAAPSEQADIENEESPKKDAKDKEGNS